MPTVSQHQIDSANSPEQLAALIAAAITQNVNDQKVIADALVKLVVNTAQAYAR